MKIPNVAPLPLLGVCLAADIGLAVVDHPEASPLVWAGAGAYSFLKGHPIWGAVFIVMGGLSYSSHKALQAAASDPPGPNGGTAVSGPKMLPSPLRGLQHVLSDNAQRARVR